MSQQPGRIERVAASAQALVVERFGIPLIALLVAVIGWFLVRTTDRIEDTQQAQGKDLSSMQSDIRDINTRLNAQVIQQVETTSKRVDRIEDRVEALERQGADR